MKIWDSVTRGDTLRHIGKYVILFLEIGVLGSSDGKMFYAQVAELADAYV